MNLTDILLIVVILLLVLLFVALPVRNHYLRLRGSKPAAAEHLPSAGAAGKPVEEKPAEVEKNGHDLSGGVRVEEPAGALESGYRRVDPEHDLSSPQGVPGKKNGRPH